MTLSTMPDMAQVVGARVIQAYLKQRAELSLARVRGKAPVQTQDGVPVSEVVVVYPPGQESDNKDPLVALLEQMIIDGVVSPHIPRPRPPGGGGDPQPTPPAPPELDPCDGLELAKDDAEDALEADELALDVLKELLRNAATGKERHAFKIQIKEVKASIKEIKDLIKDIEAEQEAQGC